MGLGLGVEVDELGVAIGMLVALGGLDVGLQAVAQLAQQPPDHEVADLVPVLSQRFVPGCAWTSTSTAAATSDRRASAAVIALICAIRAVEVEVRGSVSYRR
jgi:hypothetical protein